MLQQGVRATSIDDVLAAADASKSQLYHYFGSKNDLVEAVIDAAAAAVFDDQEPWLTALDSWDAVDAWSDHVVDRNQQRGCELGCPLGTLAAELAASNENARALLAAAFNRWEVLLRSGLTAMRDRGDLVATADVDALATATIASLQGGLLLAKTSRSVRPLRLALDAATAHLRTQASA